MNINYDSPFNFKPIPTITPASDYWQNSTWKFDMPEINAGATYQPSWIEITLHGLGALTLVNSLSDGLTALKLFGNTELLPEQYLDTVVLSGGCEQRNLPSEYTQVKYITNTAKTWLNTGVKFDFSKNYEIEIRVSASGGSWYILQAREDNSAPTHGISGSSNGNTIILGFNGSSISTSQISRFTGNIYYVKGTINNGNLTLYVKNETAGNEETVTGTYTPSTGTSVNIGLFGNGQTGGGGAQGVALDTKVYYARIKEDGNYVMNYVPCTQSTTAGFYDKASGTFKTTTDLSAGADVTAPTPNTPMDIISNNGVLKVNSQGQIYTDGTQEVVTDGNGNTANAEILLAVGNYKDTQEVLSGAVTRNLGIKVFDGSEDWYESSLTAVIRGATEAWGAVAGTSGYCTHLDVLISGQSTFAGSCRFASDFNVYYYKDAFGVNSISGFKQYLADQYTQGTPVILVYPISSATTESVAGQPLSKSPVTQTAGAISGLTVTTTESAHTTPTPTQPLDINCNNGVVKVSPNLFDVNNNLLEGYYISSTNGALMQSSDGSSSCFEDFLPSKPNVTYTMSRTTSGSTTYMRMWAYDEDKNPISLVFNQSSTQVTGTTPSGTAYIRCSFGSIPQYSQNVQLELGSSATTYMPYGQIYTDGTVETVEVTGKNLFDKSQEVSNDWYDDTGTLKTSTSTGHTEDYIYVKPNTIYTINQLGYASGGKTGVYFYDINKNWISRISSYNESSLTFTTPSNCYYVRFQVNIMTGTYSVPFDKNTCQLELGSTATTYEPYFNGGTATAEMLLAVSDYQDEQEVLDGDVTRNVGVLVLDGSEEWNQTLTGKFYNSVSGIPSGVSDTDTLKCSHFKQGLRNAPQEFEISFRLNSNGFILNWDANATIAQFKQWLADQYTNGTPVIVVYPLATSRTETVTAQPLTTQAGNNTISITQASMDDLELEVSYKAGVEVTITEVQNAQLDNNVEVTIQ